MNPCDQPGVNDGDVQTSPLVPRPSLDLKANRFSLPNARELALYARMAYDEPPTIQNTATDTQVLIRDLGNCVVVAFPGSRDLRDFITDAQCWRSYTLYGEVHHGFWDAWYSIKDDLYCALKQYSFKPILFTGHSLGGALAMIAARMLRQQMVNVHSVYCFGAPRVGDAQFRDEYNTLPVPGSPFENLGAATFTVINDCDIVPRLPGYLAGNRRPGRDEFIPEIGGIIEDPSVLCRLSSDCLSLAQGWWGKHSAAFLTELLLDHHIDNYIAALAQEKEAA